MKANARWVRSLLRADVDYFLKFSYISYTEHASVIDWLHGSGDKEAQEMIVKWLFADADYADRLNYATCRLVWYIWPLMWFAIKVMAWNLRKYAKQIKRGGCKIA